MKRRRWLAAALLPAALLAGCAQAPRAVAPDVLAGRLAVQVEAFNDSPARSFSAAFELQGNAERGTLQLTSPLGTVLARAQWRPGQALLQTSQGDSRDASLDALSERMLGEPIPLAALIEWLHGRPWAAAPVQRLPDGFEQLGWRIDLSRFTDGVLVAQRPQLPVIGVRARLDQNP
ncbi:outer membrane lipoprotein LolB [Azohydromonas caseinilytica]|uniref:Outer-membrane lipoprotein LolB n=1 Tax=Azohydromonas caseinilytica TaxID=2728836 RepID=A0A848F010_9BURK|nr:outer membrane lipoprotein LolB [Azohydromonas caseinilytica]NML13397.1 outer membrane lipoprotein LolB [Azohydromonas caseinilytica]